MDQFHASLCSILQRIGDTTGQIEPLLSSFDEPVPLTAIPINSVMLNRLDEEECVFFEDDETDADTEADAQRRQEDEDAKIPLLNADGDQVGWIVTNWRWRR